MARVRAAQKTSSSSSASPSHGYRYDVFLSFRGEDTRKNFTGHLYTAFVDQGFRTFRDDDEIERGENLNPELQKAIQQSRSSVIVFSKDYASSRWCLDEVVMILQRKRTSNGDHVVLPVFYDVDPSQVRKQTGSFATAFARHQKSSRWSNKVKQWKAALSEVADLAGMVLQNEADGFEAKFIKKIVKVIGGKLSRTPLSVAPKLFGILSQVKDINLWLQDGSTDVGILVIYGMPGIGKTSLAEFVYDSNLRGFEAMSFLANIREISEKPNGLVKIQEKLLSNILNGRKMKIHSVSEGMRRIGDAISSKKVLLVLDDVDNMDQLDAVLRMQHQFYPGSKIIITTGRARLSKAHQVTKVHEVKILDYNESLKLFNWHAFRQDYPIEGYMELSEKVVRHIGGLPLALKLLGSSLLGESDVDVWKSALKKLEAIQDSQIMNKLKISYDSLQDDHDKKLFLHIACFFVGEGKDYIVRILDGCDFFTIIGIQNLIDRCLVRINENGNLEMHDMIRDMGRGIVLLESDELGERSRLWHHKDSFKVLKEKNGTKKIEGLVLDTDVLICYADAPINSDEIVLETNAFTRMHKLRLLKLSHVQLNGRYSEFPSGLRWLYWLEFPLDSIPIDFPLESLVCLEMHYSSLKQVWQGTKCLPSLKFLDLSYSHGLTETADFSLCPNLEKLILVDCANLNFVHQSIGKLERLMYLNMKDCKTIRMLPQEVFLLKSLETFIISGCSNLNEFPMEMMRNLESLKLFEADGIPFNSMPGRSLCVSWTSLPRSLVSLSLRGCKLKVDAFPVDFGNLSSLQRLDLANNPICSLPDCIKGIARLRKLAFDNCRSLNSLVGLPEVLFLNVSNCQSLERITFQSIGFESRNDISAWGNPNLVEFGNRFKLEPIGRVDVEMINLLGLRNLEFMSTIQMLTILDIGNKLTRPIQGMYEFGIFSTFFPGNEVPGQFSHKSRESSSISFIVPLLPNHRIRGLNIFIVFARKYNWDYINVYDPMAIKVRNRSKNLNWLYFPTWYGVPDEGEDMTWLSHWKLENQIEGDDEVVVSIIFKEDSLELKEWGLRVVQEEDQHNTAGEEDPCHPFVIGADLSRYELTPGTYCLSWFSPVLNTDEDTEGGNHDSLFWDSDVHTEEEEEEGQDVEGGGGGGGGGGEEEEEDDDDDDDEEEEELQLQDDGKLAGGDNKCGIRGWKEKSPAKDEGGTEDSIEGHEGTSNRQKRYPLNPMIKFCPKKKLKTSNLTELDDALDACTTPPSAKTEVSLAKIDSKKKQVSSPSGELASIEDCMDILGTMEGVNEVAYIRVIEKFTSSDWRRIFMKMSDAGKRIWLNSLK